MSKKKITGKTKLTTDVLSPTNKPYEPLKLVAPKKEKMLPRSYRLRKSDIEDLKQIVSSANEISTSHTVSETNVIRALIFLGKKMNPEKIIKACKEIW